MSFLCLLFYWGGQFLKQKLHYPFYYFTKYTDNDLFYFKFLGSRIKCRLIGHFPITTRVFQVFFLHGNYIF